MTQCLIQVSKSLFKGIGNKSPSVTQDLATLVFGKDTPSPSTGKGKNSEVKEQLDPETVGAIIDAVKDKFPGPRSVRSGSFYAANVTTKASLGMLQEAKTNTPVCAIVLFGRNVTV
ncbi:hypothetical protein SKAU_G00070210 [Synaphobranchus kaupii]|uniref:BEN domain-containing protein n=1 Tax=Synaphobranchus kaupii TaxID=118154 RepID=A0A9Q1JAG0_SYNKA|nr:hypothetical protein SKAU_G00070210 [Synaphobranchus kaupii]